MKCPNPECACENPRETSHCQSCGEELPEPKAWFNESSLSSLGVAFGLGLVLLNFAGIYFAFSRHGTTDGFIAVCVPPYAWYRGISPLWDTPQWEIEAYEKIETVAYVVLHGQSDDVAVRAKMVERIPELQRLYAEQSPELRESIDHSLTSFIELLDVVAHDVIEEAILRGRYRFDATDIVERHKSLYEAATKYEGLHAVLNATILDADYFSRLFSVEKVVDELSNMSIDERNMFLDHYELTLERWKHGAIQTKNRILQ
ncbi:MAG: hypothetical protein DHS20C16_33250 [Phycisphaerae bacterium]|nr:MAG: hypothetical protein DHS20C16_33250 [Phycisphaerae bacterium]